MLYTMSDDIQLDKCIYDGIVNLIGAMFRLAAQDLKFGNTKTKAEAIEFLNSERFKELCESINVNADKMRRLIMTKKARKREEYQR